MNAASPWAPCGSPPHRRRTAWSSATPLVLMGPRSTHGTRRGGNRRTVPGEGGRRAEGPIVVRYNDHLARIAVPEYLATLDALQELPEIGTDGPVGYWGIHMGTAIGVPFVAVEPRITAAVFGQHWPDALAERRSGSPSDRVRSASG